MSDLIYEELTYRIRGALFEVYKEKGCGFFEGVYQECLEIELKIQNYLRATGYKLALLVNFGYFSQIQIERIAN